MDCQTASFENFYVVRWRVATGSACDRVTREVAALEAKVGDVAYLGIMPEDMERIDEPGRKALMKLTRGLADHTAAAAVAMEARGFVGAATRSMLSSVMLLQGLRTRIKFVDSVQAAMRELRGVKLPDATGMRRVIEQVGGTW